MRMLLPVKVQRNGSVAGSRQSAFPLPCFHLAGWVWALRRKVGGWIEGKLLQQPKSRFAVQARINILILKRKDTFNTGTLASNIVSSSVKP